MVEMTSTRSRTQAQTADSRCAVSAVTVVPAAVFGWSSASRSANVSDRSSRLRNGHTSARPSAVLVAFQAGRHPITSGNQRGAVLAKIRPGDQGVFGDHIGVRRRRLYVVAWIRSDLALPGGG